MLKKLLKYDLKWCYKPLVVFYVLALIFAVITRIIEQFDYSFIFLILDKIFSGAEIAMLINILINNFLRVWARFIKNIYKDESYLTHTLPVSKNTIYLSKILSAIITMLTSAIVIVICLGICCLTEDSWNALKVSMEQTAIYFDSTVSSFLTVMIITVFFQMLFAIFAGYMGIIIGHKANNWKMIKSILVGMLCYTIPSIVTLGMIYMIGLFHPEVMNLFNSVTGISTEAIKIVLFGGIIMYILYDVVYYILGRKILEKGVNVD